MRAGRLDAGGELVVSNLRDSYPLPQWLRSQLSTAFMLATENGSLYAYIDGLGPAAVVKIVYDEAVDG